jgi:uroporphyrinogen-III synthase
MSQSGEFSQQLRELGAEVLEMPTLVITPPDSWQELDRAIHHLGEYEWLILTSANGVTSFLERLQTLGLTYDCLSHLRIAVVGGKTAQVLQAYGIHAHLIPEQFIADRLAESLALHLDHPSKILFPRVQSGGRDILLQALAASSAQVDAVPAYESRCPDTIPPAVVSALQNHEIHAITFTSSKTVRHFQTLLDQVDSQWRRWLEQVHIISIGSQTSRTCGEIFHREPIEAPTATLEGMVQAICTVFAPPCNENIPIIN